MMLSTDKPIVRSALARGLYAAWLSSHGIVQAVFEDLDEWSQGYWFYLADYVLDWFEPKQVTVEYWIRKSK